jgi:hypothetical protein
MKKSERDFEMKHKNRSSQAHSKISLQRFEMGEARDVWERVGGVYQVRNGAQIVLMCVGREVGVSIYRWSSKLAVGQIFLPETGWTAPGRSGRLSWQTDWQTDLQVDHGWPDRLNHPLGRLNRPWHLWQPVCQSDWQTVGQRSEESETSWTAPQDQFNRSWPESLGEKTPAELPRGKFSWCMVKEVHSWSWVQLELRKLNSAEVQLSCSWRSSTQLKSSSAGKLSCSWRSSAAFQQEHSRFLKPNHGQPKNVKVIYGFQK